MKDGQKEMKETMDTGQKETNGPTNAVQEKIRVKRIFCWNIPRTERKGERQPAYLGCERPDHFRGNVLMKPKKTDVGR
jgi:hypothetical protein